VNLDSVRRRAARLKRHFYESVTKGDGGRHAPQMPKFLPVLIAVFSVAMTSAWLIFVGFARLIGYDISPLRPLLGSLPPDRLFDVTRAAATAAGVLVGVFAIVYAYRKQRVDEAGGQRDDSAQLSERYQIAAEELGHPRAAVRLAGVYAMSRLADDWVEQRQQCVDVLCAYLRLPLGRPDVDAAEEEVLRRAIVSEINLHTQPDRTEENCWSELRIDLSGAELQDLTFYRNRFRELVLERATIRGSVLFTDCAVERGLDMSDIHVHGSVNLALRGPLGRVSLWGAELHGGGTLTITDSQPTGIQYSMSRITIGSAAEVRITLADGSRNGTYDLRYGKVAGRLAIYGTGESCEPGAIKMRDLATTGAGRVGLQGELADAREVVKPALVPSENLSLARFEVGEWQRVEDD
jgi:hypothetical protein